MRQAERIRLYVIGAVIGTVLIAYLLAYLRLPASVVGLGLLAGFVTGYLVDASAREKSLRDNLAIGLLLAGLLGYFDYRVGLTIAVRDKLGTGFVLAVSALLGLIQLSATVNEEKVGRTVRIPWLPSLLTVTAIGLLMLAIQPTTVHIVRSSTPSAPAIIHYYTDTGSVNVEAIAQPIVNGTVSYYIEPITIDNVTYDKISYTKISIRTKNDSRIREPGTLAVNITRTTSGYVAGPRETGDFRLIFVKDGNEIYTIYADSRSRDNVTGTASANFSITAAVSYYASISDYVVLLVDPHRVELPVTITISMAVITEIDVQKNYAYGAMIILLLAFLLAVPDLGLRRRIKRRRRRR